MERSYPIHTGNELELMLAGKKPLAMFYRASSEDFDEFEGQNFARYVADGTFQKLRFFLRSSDNNYTVIYTIYTVAGEHWRAVVLRALKRQDVWSRDMELIEGTLLGYSLDECAEHLRITDAYR